MGRQMLESDHEFLLTTEVLTVHMQ